MIPGPPVTFVPAPTKSGHTQRVACSVCGRTGRTASGPNSWQETCRRGHSRCRCGRWLSVRMDGTPRKHRRCPSRGAV